MSIKNIFKGSPSSPNRVNVGCGPKARAGWLNVDIQSFPSVDRVMDVTEKWDFKNLDYVYAEHFLEHLEITKGIDFLYNAGCSLGENGVLRLSTPNVEWVVKSHYKENPTSDSDISFNSVTAINRAFYGWGHQFLYSEWMLTKILSDIGFCNITFFAYGESERDTFKNIEEHGGYFINQGSPSVIIVEAQKSGKVKYPKDLLQRIREGFTRYANAKG